MSNFVSPDHAAVGLRYVMVSDFSYHGGDLGYVVLREGHARLIFLDAKRVHSI